MTHPRFSLLIFALFVLNLANPVLSQTIKNSDLNYDSNIQTVLLYPLGDQLSDPVIKLNAGEKLQLEFDDLNTESYTFRYTIIHCDRDWHTSELQVMDYLEGFSEGDITNYQFSLNAIPSYVHYRAVIPSGDMHIKLSGNYILKVYLDNDDDENVIFTRRFFVYEELATVGADIPYYPKKLEYTQHKQQIDLTVRIPDLFNTQADQRVRVFIRQNGRWDNMKRNLVPTTVMSNRLDYNYPDGIVFDGGNQFRFFDMKSYYYQAPNIRRIISDDKGYEVILHTDYSRAKRQYETYTDIHGMRLVKARNNQETNIEGEYARVDFSLKVPRFFDAEVYIIGALTDWQLDPNSKMVYNESRRMYTKTLFLKQGYYNYKYVVLPNDKTVADVTLLEGDFWDTQNLYKVYVYYRNIMPEYDRLIGYHEFNSFSAKR